MYEVTYCNETKEEFILNKAILKYLDLNYLSTLGQM